MRGSRLLIDWCVLAALATALGVTLSLTGATQRIDNLVYDRLISTRAPLPSEKIIIIAVDNRSLAAIGKWPWPRSVHAQMLTQLAQAHPQSIAYDVLFTEPAKDDAVLATALRKAAPVYLPLLLDEGSSENQNFSEVEPVKALHDAAAGIGHVNVKFDSDGIVRRADLSLTTQHQVWPHMMQLLAGGKAKQMAPLPIVFQPSVGAFRTTSFVDVLRGEVPGLFFKDKLVIIGAAGDGMGDQFPVPLRGGGLMTGIDLQANMLNTMLSGNSIRTVPRWLGALCALLPLWILLIGFWRWRPTVALRMSLLLLLGIVLFTVGLFVWGGIWFPPSPALMALIFVYPVWGWRRLEALSGSVEHEMTAFHETHQAAAPRFARSDRIASQVDDVRAAMQHSRDVSKGAQDREEALQMLSHDMRAPQASIITLLETEGRGLAPALTARLTGYARRTLALADNFVQLARVNETPFAPEEVNLCDVLNEAIDELYPLYSARKIHVCASGVEEPHYIMAEPGLIIRVILNLLDNAIKYSPEGSSIQCALLYDSQNVRCIITDQGVGMSTDQVAGLFARFSKIGDKRSAGSSGAGLGLTLVKSVMERHGGSVDCRSERGKGSSFTLRFPAAD